MSSLIFSRWPRSSAYRAGVSQVSSYWIAKLRRSAVHSSRPAAAESRSMLTVARERTVAVRTSIARSAFAELPEIRGGAKSSAAAS
jgi:hypothetical protein